MSYAGTIHNNHNASFRRGGTSIVLAQLFGALFILQLGFREIADQSNALFFNATFCILLIALTGGAALRYALMNRLFVLTPIPWFYLACGLYFGMGPLMWNFAGQATVAYVDTASRVPIDNLRVLDANLLSAAGLAVVSATLAALQLAFNWERRAPQNYLDQFSAQTLSRMFWTSVLIGGAVKYLLVIPASLGVFGGEIPNFISQLTLLLKVGIIVGYMARARGARGVRAAHTAIIGFELLTAVMSTSKTETLTVILMVIIGQFITQRPMRQAIVLGLCAALFYVSFLSNFVSFVRMNYSTTGITSVGALVDATSEFIATDQTDIAEQSGVQMWWARLTFSNFQVFAIDSYESGRNGNTLIAALWGAAPRFLFPNKPILNAGSDFSEELMTGSSEWVQTSMTYFAEGYWNGGVWGLIFVSCWASGVFVTLAYILFSAFAAGRIGVMLMASTAIPMGLGIEGWFASGLAGGFALALLYAFIGYLYDQATAGKIGPFALPVAYLR
jgi:hypothetical protein